MKFSLKNYDDREDMPSINDIYGLTDQVIKDLPSPDKIYHRVKPEVVSVYITYINLDNKQKEKLIKNIESQRKWVFLDNNKDGMNYCHNQYHLVIYEEAITNDVMISIGWSQASKCRRTYLNINQGKKTRQ
ncbi:hypothetical protein LU293_03370 [Moraxella nasovis]|uniref:hypothetical protein n=1 Tax=Moraxella nasovis TaxID=2904121 RepID=UPI001F618521|nr:hypothetical protein [Moraxella nasovis]UNU73950.1 hypothetical protein LU293_03370 [Moraxella nasovis]